MIAEERKLAIGKAEASAVKAKRKQARKNKKKKIKRASANHTVAALNVKTYNALGAEFEDLNDGVNIAGHSTRGSSRVSTRKVYTTITFRKS